MVSMYDSHPANISQDCALVVPVKKVETVERFSDRGYIFDRDKVTAVVEALAAKLISQFPGIGRVDVSKGTLSVISSSVSQMSMLVLRNIWKPHMSTGAETLSMEFINWLIFVLQRI